jgi:hypothetical protein
LSRAQRYQSLDFFLGEKCRLTVAQTTPGKSKLAGIIELAAKEGEVVYQAPDPETGLPAGDFLRDMAAITQKHFGVKLNIKIDNSLNFPASVAKALTEMKSGAAPSVVSLN